MLANIIRNTKKTAIGGGGGGIVTGGDPYYSAVSMLLPMDGTNGSTTFTDSGPNALAVTAVGNAQVSTTQAKYGGASGYFDGSAGYLSPPASSGFSFGTGNVTIEAWVYPTATTGNFGIYATSAGGGPVAKFVVFLDSLSPNCHFYGLTNGNNIYTKATSTVAVNQWSHIAFVRSGTTWTWYINGVASGSGTNSTAITFSTEPTYIGYGGQAFFNYFSGYIDDLRVTKYARYVSNFTPPTTALPTTASSTPADPYYGYTSLLLHMDGTSGSTNFVDSGPSALAVTAAANAQISTTQVKYGSASGYFDGTGDSLTIPANTALALGAGDYTIEGWFYSLTSGTSLRGMIDFRTAATGTNGLMLRENDGGFLVYLNSGTLLSTTTGRVANQWQHIALVRKGTAVTLYVDGVSRATATSSTTLTDNVLRISGFVDTQSNLYTYNGYMDEIRITKYARYQSSFTPPTQAHPNIYNPYTTLPVSGAALWLAGDDSSTLYTDAGTSAVTKSGDLVYQWTDKSGNSRNAIQATSGNRPTWVAPANARNNLGALGFNASQWIDLADNTSLAFGTGDFTVECWIKPTSFSGTSFLLGAGANSFCIYFASTGTLNIGHYGVAGLGASSVISTSTWTHVAISRSGTSLRVFLNGILTNTFTNSSNFQGSQVTRVGWDPAPSNGNIKYNGQIQNLLVYNGQALYTANFVPWMS